MRGEGVRGGGVRGGGVRGGGGRGKGGEYLSGRCFSRLVGAIICVLHACNIYTWAAH